MNMEQLMLLVVLMEHVSAKMLSLEKSVMNVLKECLDSPTVKVKLTKILKFIDFKRYFVNYRLQQSDKG